jgi:SagB-type dehydrogenase family enzyme
MAEDREEVPSGREFLKDNVRRKVNWAATDQHRGVPPPPVSKSCPPERERVDLPGAGGWRDVAPVDLAAAMAARRSHRRFRKEALSLDELSFLLWATQGIRAEPHGGNAFRTVPSAGCRHALETYLCVLQVEELERGIYRYLPLEHRLLREGAGENLAERLVEATLGQPFTGRGAVTFVWTAVPYRMEWRYGAASYKVLALDAGHVCQNLYLACEAVGAGTCAVAAYDQGAMDRLLGVDGEEEFTLYIAPVGKV